MSLLFFYERMCTHLQVLSTHLFWLQVIKECPQVIRPRISLVLPQGRGTLEKVRNTMTHRMHAIDKVSSLFVSNLFTVT